MQTLYFRNGTISTGGVNLKDIDLKWWRSQIGLVQQEPFLFNDTIFKNVQYGLIGTEWEHESEEKKREMVEAACKEAFADEFITRLPDVFLPSISFLECLKLISSGLRHAMRRRRHQTLRWSTPTSSHRPKHYQKTQNLDSR